MVEEVSDGQVTPDSIDDVDLALPAFPNVLNPASETDWAKYLLWIEDDMSCEERMNNNMLLTNNSIRELSSHGVIMHLSLDIKPSIKQRRRNLLFKDLPGMRREKHDGLAMYILGYDATDRLFFVRRFERLSSKIELLPRYWDCGSEMLALSVGRLLQMLRDSELRNASSDHSSVLPEWDEELGFKIVVVAMFAQWMLDFSSGFQMTEEVVEITNMLLSRWKDSLLSGSVGATSHLSNANAGKGDEGTSGNHSGGGAQVVKELKTPAESPLCDDCSKSSQTSDLGDDKRAGHASSPVATAPHYERGTTYDSDEEEEWAGLQEWATRSKLRQSTEAVTTEAVAGPATLREELKPESRLRPTSPLITPEGGEPLSDSSDPASSIDVRRFSDSSTLFDEGGKYKASLTFTEAMRNAMLKECSIEAMLKVYSEFVKEHVEHNVERKRFDLFEFLVAHVEENDSSSLFVKNTRQEPKERDLAEEPQAHMSELGDLSTYTNLETEHSVQN